MSFVQAPIEIFGVKGRDPGWVYAICSGRYVKVGRTMNPVSRLREARTWCAEGVDDVLMKPFWGIRKIEYSLHAALVEHWHRGEWHLFHDNYWRDFFLDGFRQFRDVETGRDANSIDFGYWMNGSGYGEWIDEQCRTGLTLPKWRKSQGDAWDIEKPHRKP